jgi:hypothetical protein
MARQIVKTEATTLFPDTKNDVMMTIETEKMELVFNLPHDRAIELAKKLLEKAR